MSALPTRAVHPERPLITFVWRVVGREVRRDERQGSDEDSDDNDRDDPSQNDGDDEERRKPRCRPRVILFKRGDRDFRPSEPSCLRGVRRADR